jgi:peptide/nickel transport system substrate-binding protein
MRAVLAATRRARRRGIRSRGAIGACCAAVGLALILAACGPVSGSAAGGDTPVSGGTLTYANEPQFNATYIFPFTDPNDYTVANIDYFQYFLYRPLYWFGRGNTPYMNNELSLAYPPTYNGQQVTIKLKPNYKWANGEPVDAQDVVFWLHMMQAETSNWGGYVPGGIPTNIKNVRAKNSSTVTMDVIGKYSENWFTDNELSQITPMPMAWDVTGPGQHGNCEKVASACGPVYNYLNKQAKDVSSYGTSPLWSVVDGPWKVQSLGSDGRLVLAINPKYSGTLPAHHITKFVEVPFTSEQAEYNVLQDSQSSQRIDVGYLPTVDAPVPSAGSQVGVNPPSLTNYQLSVVYAWQLSYFPYNFQNTSPQGPVMKQLYFRQAFQHLVDQEGIIQGPLHGYGRPTIGPVGDYPVTKYLSPTLRRAGDQWPLSTATAVSLLRSHGWSVVTNGSGVDTCRKAGSGPGQCGPGIRAGTPLQFTLTYATGIDWMESAVKELVSNASLVGIKIIPDPETIGTTISDVFFCAPNCGHWQMAYWGSWTYSPDFLPTGDTLFGKGSVNNGGNYDVPENNRLITASLQARTQPKFLQAMYSWEDWLAGQLPVVYEPDAPTLVENIRNVHIGVQNPALTLTPEDWYFVK